MRFIDDEPPHIPVIIKETPKDSITPLQTPLFPKKAIETLIRKELKEKVILEEIYSDTLPQEDVVGDMEITFTHVFESEEELLGLMDTPILASPTSLRS